jgi:hypothetical protein
MTDIVDAMKLTDSEFGKAKEELLAAAGRPTPAQGFSRARLEDEIRRFEESGGKSAFPSSTTPPQPGTGTTVTPPAPKVVTTPKNALDMNDREWQEAKRLIASGKHPTAVPNIA